MDADVVIDSVTRRISQLREDVFRLGNHVPVMTGIADAFLGGRITGSRLRIAVQKPFLAHCIVLGMAILASILLDRRPVEISARARPRPGIGRSSVPGIL